MEQKNVITDEQQLIRGCIEGKSWAQRAIYETYAASMLSVCVRYVTDRETARDLLQEGFIKLFTKIHSYTGAGAFGGWVRRIFVTTSLEYLRQNNALKQSVNIDEHGYFIENMEETVFQKLSADDLMECIAGLADGYRTIFNLYAIEGYSHAEIAEMLGINEATSRSQYMRARKILQENILILHGKEYAKQYR